MIASIFSETSRNLYVSVSGHFEVAPRASFLLRTFPKYFCEFSLGPPAEYCPSHLELCPSPAYYRETAARQNYQQWRHLDLTPCLIPTRSHK